MIEKFDTHKMTDHLYTCWGKSINYEDKLCKFSFILLDIPFQYFVSTLKKKIEHILGRVMKDY